MVGRLVVHKEQIDLEQIEPTEGFTVYELCLEPPEQEGEQENRILVPRAWFRRQDQAVTWAKKTKLENIDIREGLPESYV